MDNNFKCIICNKIFKQKIHYINHTNKKNKCSKDDILIFGKKVYKCNLCDKLFNQKCNYLVHINRKNKCIHNNDNIDNNIINNNNDNIYNNNIDINIINYNNIDNNIDNIDNNIIDNNNDNIDENKIDKVIIDDNNINNSKIKYNINITNNLDEDLNNVINKRVKNNKIVINEELMMEMIEELKSKLIDQSNKLSEQEKEINELKKSKRGPKKKIINNVDNNTNNGAINNGTINNTVNNITYVNHGKEDLSKLIKSEISEIINAGLNSVTKSVLLTHCNDRLPQYKNIRYSDTKSSYCEIIEDGEWKKNNFVIVLSELLLKHYMEVTHLSEENKDLFESKFKEKILKDHLEDYKKFIMFETDDQYPNNWNDTMKKEKQREIRKIVNRNRENIKSLIIQQTMRDKIKMLN